MHKYLEKSTDVPFEKIFLDPNNPRTAPEDRPGYADPKLLFEEAVQTPLMKRMEEFTEVAGLEPVIISQGWLPIDPMLVWEHPKRPNHYVVIEGNTRTVVLRRVRRKLVQESAHLEKMEKKSKGYAKQDIEEQQKLVDRLQGIVNDTDKLVVFPIKAATAAELEDTLPRLHGVRHISHAQPWSPYATNLYLLSRYGQLFEEQYGEKTDLRIEDNLVKKLAASVSLRPTKARQNIQAASAFSHFKRGYDHRMPAGGQLKDKDQYFFELILQNEYPQSRFGFAKTDLHLSPEMEEVLFKWAFAEPRPDGKENPNKLYQAENIRLWHTMHRYDTKKATNFAERFDVDDPDSAPQMAEVEAEYLAHKAQVSPLYTIASLLTALKNLKMETLMSQGSSLRPMIEEMIAQGQKYLKVLDALVGKAATK